MAFAPFSIVGIMLIAGNFNNVNLTFMVVEDKCINRELNDGYALVQFHGISGTLKTRNKEFEDLVVYT